MSKFAKKDTSFFIEISAGLTTFFSMIYVLAANPAIISASGMPPAAVFTATAVGVILATLLMALVADLPFAVAPGMGLNAFFVVIVTQMGYTWNQALVAVLVSGAIFVLLSVTPARDKVLREVPKSLQHGVSAGIGLMIAFIGLLNSKVVVLSEQGPGLGDLSGGPALLAVVGLLVTGLLLALKSRFAILVGIIITTLIGISLGVTDTSGLSAGFVSLPPSFSAIFLKFDFSPLGSIDFWSLIITLLFMEVIDGLAGFLGLFGVMGADGDRYRPKMGRAFIADSLGVVVGSCLGLSPNTTYAESGAGVASGGRTGVTAMVVAAGFLLALFISPLFMLVPFSAVAPALVLVGLLMLNSITKIDFKDFTEVFPAFVVTIVIALTWRISDGLALGWLIFILMKVISGQARQLTTTVWVVGAIFAWKLFHGLVNLG
ncbi:MAG: NCS2 family permease [Deltaproteobacteria bacterium]|jgi:AGZA family xanthine/uracil permease-like MFS transporter|nr:NCS2 family permease [Deltaproteobacteria bacterium]